MTTPSNTSPTTVGSLSGATSTSTTAPAPGVGGSSGPPPILIAKQFIKQYYPILTLSPQHIPKFYHPTDSQLRYTTSMLDNHNGEAAVVNFVELIPRLDFARGAKMDLASGFIDAQRTLDGGVLIVIIGEMTLRKNWQQDHLSPSPSPDADALSSSSEEDGGKRGISISASAAVHEFEDFKRKFVHTFVLTPRSRGSGGKKNLYVSNDVFRFLDLSPTPPPPTAPLPVGADVTDQQKTDIVGGAAVAAAADGVGVVDPTKDVEGTSTAATAGSTAASTDAASAGGSRSSGVTIASSTMDGPRSDLAADQDHAISTKKAMVSLEKEIISVEDGGALVTSHVVDPTGAADAVMDEGLRLGGTGTGVGRAVGKSKPFLVAAGKQQQQPAYGMTSIAANSDIVLPVNPIGSTPPRQLQQAAGATLKVQPSVSRSPVGLQQQQQQHPPAGSWASMVARTTTTLPWGSSPAPATTGNIPEPLPVAMEGDSSKAASGVHVVTGGTSTGTTITTSDDSKGTKNGEKGRMVKMDAEAMQTVGRKHADPLEPFSSTLSKQRHASSKTSPGERALSSSGGNASASVYIRNVPHNSTQEHFLDMFAHNYPRLKVIHIALYASRRFAFVEFSTKEAVQTVLQGANARKIACPWAEDVYLEFERKNPDRHGTGSLGRDRVDRGGGGVRAPAGARDSWDAASKGTGGGGGSASGNVRGGRYSRPKMQHGTRDRDEHVGEHIKRGSGGGGGGGGGRSGSRGRGERSSGGKDTRRPFPSRTEKT